MTQMIRSTAVTLTRRHFVVGSAALGGLALGFNVPFAAQAQDAPGRTPPGDRAMTPLDHLAALRGGYFPLVDADSGRTHHVYVRLPEGYEAEPGRRWPVVYLLDGDSLFPLLASTHLFLTYDEALRFWFRRINYEIKSPEPADLKLDRIRMHRDARGLILSLPEDAAFGVASADVSGEARQMIDRIAAAVAPTPNAIRVEGHTDDVPIRTSRYTSNWELSTARASAVVEYLVRSSGLDPERLSAAGYGEFHPRVPNDTPENRASNRRIDIVILDGAPR